MTLAAEMQPKPVFIDAFSGCGGLSLGLLRAGWHGLFAIEKDQFAFETFVANLPNGRYKNQYSWPAWLPQQPTSIETLLDAHSWEISELRGNISLLAGGPPCQGFSSAGRRNASDPRNSLMNAYLKLVHIIEPSMVLLENVRGITIDFNKPDGVSVNYADHLKNSLDGYEIFWTMADASEFGVPQARTRFILIALRRDLNVNTNLISEYIERARRRFLRVNGLLPPISVSAAISDLELSRNGSTASTETKGFDATCYLAPRTHYQRLMREGSDGPPSDTRLARHKPEISARFAEIIEKCHKQGRLSTSIGREMREDYGLKKQALRVLDPERPAPTITSMPDDLLHYCEPRTLTVRENARLQGFPDWFAFKGKYTTGGDRRRREVPRFTQVANAVPPPMAEVLGSALMDILELTRNANAA